MRQVCREAGGKSDNECFRAGHGFGRVQRTRWRRWEIVADGLNFVAWGTALSSSPPTEGTDLPEVVGEGGRACLVVLAAEVGG